MDLGDQWAGGINYTEPTLFTVIANFGRDPVRTVNHAFTLGNFVNRVHKNRALTGEFLNHKSVVNDFLPNVDWRPEGLKRNADNVNGTHHAGTKSSWLQQKQRFLAIWQWQFL
jgi:hypothetical protein